MPTDDAQRPYITVLYVWSSTMLESGSYLRLHFTDDLVLPEQCPKARLQI
jgi:hypothetical protein